MKWYIYCQIQTEIRGGGLERAKKTLAQQVESGLLITVSGANTNILHQNLIFFPLYILFHVFIAYTEKRYSLPQVTYNVHNVVPRSFFLLERNAS